MSIFHLSSFHSLTHLHSFIVSHVFSRGRKFGFWTIDTWTVSFGRLGLNRPRRPSLLLRRLQFPDQALGDRKGKMAVHIQTEVTLLIFVLTQVADVLNVARCVVGGVGRCVVHVELAAVLRRRNGPMRLTVSTLGHILPSDVVVISGRGTRLICSRTCCHRCRDFTVDMTEIGGIGHRSTNRIIVLHVTTVEEDVRRSQLCWGDRRWRRRQVGHHGALRRWARTAIAASLHRVVAIRPQRRGQSWKLRADVRVALGLRLSGRLKTVRRVIVWWLMLLLLLLVTSLGDGRRQVGHRGVLRVGGVVSITAVDDQPVRPRTSQGSVIRADCNRRWLLWMQLESRLMARLRSCQRRSGR